jgi:quinol monooxygenase YgiN
MSGFAIIVDFRLKPGAGGDFRRLVEANADASVRDEPGCRRFDVVVPRGDQNRVLLYEIYDDDAAFDDHCRTHHYARFDRESESLVEAKLVIRCDLVREGRADMGANGGG